MGYLVAVDGPLRQPFSDYMEMSEANAEYDTRDIAYRSALHSIPIERRMTFADQHKVYTRLEAMKVAKEQALVREKAADYIKQGKTVPSGALMNKYEKTIDIKLGGARRRQQRSHNSQRQVSPRPNTGSNAGYRGVPTILAAHGSLELRSCSGKAEAMQARKLSANPMSLRSDVVVGRGYVHAPATVGKSTAHSGLSTLQQHGSSSAQQLITKLPHGYGVEHGASVSGRAGVIDIAQLRGSVEAPPMSTPGTYGHVTTQHPSTNPTHHIPVTYGGSATRPWVSTAQPILAQPRVWPQGVQGGA